MDINREWETHKNICKKCGIQFSSKYYDDKYCSDECVGITYKAGFIIDDIREVGDKLVYDLSLSDWGKDITILNPDESGENIIEIYGGDRDPEMGGCTIWSGTLLKFNLSKGNTFIWDSGDYGRMRVFSEQPIYFLFMSMDGHMEKATTWKDAI